MKQLTLFACTLLTTLLSFGQTKSENLKITIPEENKWKIGYQEEDSVHQYVELIPVNEEMYEWTKQVVMSSLKSKRIVSLDAAMNSIFDQTKESVIKPVLTLVEKNYTTKNPWIIFKIEGIKFKNDTDPESQLYYIIQGETALYTNFVTIKEKTLSKEFVAQWTKAFKTSKLVYQ